MASIVVIRKLLVVLMSLSPAATCLAGPDTMLCLHRDGRVRVEPFEPSCCRGEHADSSTPSCPDDECQDLSVGESSPISSPDAALVLEVCSAPADPPVDRVCFLPIPELHRPRSFSGPPPPGPERHVTTVVLRH